MVALRVRCHRAVLCHRSSVRDIWFTVTNHRQVGATCAGFGKLDEVRKRSVRERRRNVGELLRYADDGVPLCRSAAQAEHARAMLEQILASLGLRLHPDKTNVVDLREGREGLDFLGCHFRARMSGRLWEQKRIIRYYLHRWPSQTAMARMRAKVRDRTRRNRVGIDIRDVIAAINPILRGWGNYFRTGNAGFKFIQIDRYVTWRLKRLLIKKRGRNLRAGQADQWTEEWFNGHGLHRLRGTIRYPKAA